MKNRPRTLAIFTLVTHKKKEGKLYGYSPYVSEINMWSSHFENIIVVGCFSKSKDIDRLEKPYAHNNVELLEVPVFNIKSILGVIKLVLNLPLMVYKMAKAMQRADHLHFRCPSNVSAVAALIQVFYPKKNKTTKYAGNWDPKSNQPMGYRFQKWLLSNTLLTKNMKVLVYGDWKDKSSYVVPFMSATYNESEKIEYKKRDFSGHLKFVFTGAMVTGKRPLLTIKIIEALIHNGFSSELHMFGDGPLIDDAKSYIKSHGLEDAVFIYGNQPKEQVKQCLLNAHFTILPSKSEGWPKAIAEGMFFGAIPISTKISCLPWILDFGKRGILIEPSADSAVKIIIDELEKGDLHLNQLSKKALEWSQQYTVDKLELEISKLVNN
ncbi:glycosyl transferase [Winogradskyella sp. J14-2]|uniref:glycosyltransferase n=1 Tax=Winogradskyella sp. J14-2 TaxID=1936080 RepID=UPI0009726AD3|nr:glycosyltransferase [Winogradskyella sp. J14-2]APY07537.1 glycosyl transferase [Winogradskyella sp. J14-2]